jgi:glycosyltransferase involved in cell wall biosynthesis
MTLPRVLFVIGSNGTGGTELQVRALIDGLTRRGASVKVLLLDGIQGVDGLPADTVVVARGRPGWVASVLVYASAVRKIRTLLGSGDFDVVHGVHARGYALAAVGALGVRNIRRVAWRRNLGIHLVGGKALAMRLVERLSLRVTDVVITNSEDVRDYWVSRHGLALGKVLVIPNLLQEWRFEVDRNAGRQSTIVAVGGLRPVKGHDVLVRAVGGLGRRDVELVILGEGECRAALTRLAKDLEVRLVLPGVRPDPRPWLATAAIYVHPSISEGASNAVLEAMAAGVAVVASDVGGMRELLGQTGVLVPAGDESGLRDAISQLLDSPATCRRLGQESQRRARERFSESRVVESTIGAYLGELPCAAS